MRLKLALLVAAAAAIAAASAGATSTPLSPAAGTVTTATHPTFTWTIASGEVIESVEIASSPETTPTGNFAATTLVESEALSPDATSWKPTKPLLAGKYWWHVVSHDTAPGLGWQHLFTPAMALTVSATVQLQSIALKQAGNQLLTTVSLLANVRNVNMTAKLFSGKKQIGVQKAKTDNFLVDQPVQQQSFWIIPGTVPHRTKLRLVVTLTVAGQKAKATATKTFRYPSRELPQASAGPYRRAKQGFRLNRGMVVPASTLTVAGTDYAVWKPGDVSRLPFTLRVLLENVLRTSTDEDAAAVREWVASAEPSRSIDYTPARVIHQDFTGVPAVVDLAAMRNAMRDLGGDAARINPLLPSELVIDHSVQVDVYATADAIPRTPSSSSSATGSATPSCAGASRRSRTSRSSRRRPGSSTRSTSSTSPGSSRSRGRRRRPGFPDTLVGTDSHTTMVNGLGVLGWGVGGIEAEAAMLGQAISMLVPQVVGFKLHGRLPEGATATDLVLTVTQILRKVGVVGKFVEYFGEGLAALPVADRATIGNMSPEYGATCGFFPVDERP